ncbi:tetratricopeptide repeat protein [Lutibacter profundi]|nr:tetratricopeptide repeat protein [Lutibacter profundi]
MKNIFKIVGAFFMILFVVGCSTKKDAFLNRNFQAMATKYNVLYNGNEALKKGLLELNSNYSDNYWQRLPIEPLKIDELALPGVKLDKDISPKEFEKAEEKAVKAIQKHSMLIARQERNSQIDDAYLLLGKSRYYSKRFVPALEAFNFVILNYPNADLIDETKIWQAKTLIRLQNEEQAIENLNNLLKDKELKDKIKEQAHTAIAMAYVKKDSLQQVINHLKKAILADNNNEQTARNLFILGQVYREKKLIDSSNISFQELINFKKAPFKYKIHAYIEKAKNVSTKEEALATIAILKKLLKDRDNRPYLEEIYYQLGAIENKIGLEGAIEYYKKSLQASKTTNLQKEITYQSIGDLYFDKAKFVTAGLYYDSILNITKEKHTKRIRRLTRKRNNLNEVIFYEKIAKTNDSILKVASMSKEEQIAFFTGYIEKLKANEELLQQKINTGSAFYNSNNLNEENSNAGKWYFYNIQAVGFGEQEFQRVWGNRPLEDNWRLSDKTQLNLENSKTNITQKNDVINTPEKLKLPYYLNKVVTSKHKIDSITKERNDAYFKLGIIYKEQFKEFSLATDKLEKLLTFNPVSTLLLPTKYHLYKIYSHQNNKKAILLKNDIINTYPNSKYAKIILNPNEVLNNDSEITPKDEYAAVFYEYKDKLYEEVIKKTTIAISKYEGEKIVSKFELLKAYAIGKKEGLEAFKKALNFVAMNYPNTEEGKKALEVINTIKTKI